MERFLEKIPTSTNNSVVNKVIAVLVVVLLILIAVGEVGDGVSYALDIQDLLDRHLAIADLIYLLGLSILLLISFRIGQSQRGDPVQTAEGELAEAIRLSDLDYDLFLNLEQLAESSGGLVAAERVAEDALQAISTFFGMEIIRASILRPAEDALVAWVGYQMPASSLELMRFPFSPTPGDKKGVALEAWETGKIRFVTSREEDGRRWFESPHYRVLPHKSQNRPYRSFVCVPLRASPRNELGIFCLDSESASRFAPKGANKERLESDLGLLAVRLSASIAVINAIVAADERSVETGTSTNALGP